VPPPYLLGDDMERRGGKALEGEWLASMDGAVFFLRLRRADKETHTNLLPDVRDHPASRASELTRPPFSRNEVEGRGLASGGWPTRRAIVVFL